MHLLTGRWSARLIVFLMLVGSGLLIVAAGSARTSNDPTAGLPSDSQSTIAARLQQQLPSARTAPAVVVYSRGGAPLTAADRAAIAAARSPLARFAVGAQLPPTQVSQDGQAAVLVVALASDAAADPNGTRLNAQVAAIRAQVRTGLPAGLDAQVTGGAAFSADVSNAFDGADLTLLLATVAVVAVLLLVTYRSPVLWLVPLAVVGLADRVTSALIALVSRHSDLPISQATTGIVQVLVFGAGTDYALLLIARYREELLQTTDRRTAMRRALRAAGPAILASGTTVVLALLSLLLAVLGDDRAIGVAGAIGIATAMLFGLTLLPTALVSLPRGLFWPLVPRPDERGRRTLENEGRLWRRIGERTARRPWPITIGSVLLLGLLAAGLVGTSLGLSQADSFRTKAESVTGLTTLARSFPAGAADPVAVLTPDETAQQVLQLARAVPGVASARIGEQGAGVTEVEVILTAAPDTSASYDAITAVRDRLAGVSRTYVGGTVATDLDVRAAAIRDLRVIAPVILVIVFVVLTVLLRALVAPVLLIATVVLTFFAALGAAAWSFRHIFHFAGLGDQVPLLAFLFLVALGVDYNIFLATRAREEAARTATRKGMIDALAVTGGVITSAGILLAAVFAVLGVLPVIVLTEVGVIVGIGVLLDTLLVRTVLVPALAQLLGERFWWPGRPAQRHHGRAGTGGEPELVQADR